MKDLTSLVYAGPLWFLLGVFLFYAITVVKVYILWYIQPKLYVPDDPLFKNFFQGLFKTLWDPGKKILLPSFSYMFRRDDKDFMLVEHQNNKSIKTTLNILKGFTTFLQPYLIFSFLYVFVRLWIDSHLFYHPLQITLAQIQLKINYVNHLPLIKYLQDHKLYIFFGYGILCILIPFLYDREQGAKKAKLYFSNSLLYLSLIGAVTFFGAHTGQFAMGRQDKLADLRAEITALHDSIFKEAVVMIEANDLKQVVKQEDEQYVKAIDSLDAAAKLPIDEDIEPSIAKKYQEELSAYTNKARYQYSLIRFTADNITADRPVTPVAKTFEKFYSTNRTAAAHTYMGDRSAWNMTDGRTILNNIEQTATAKNLFTTDLDKKFKKVLEKLFDLGYELSIGGLETQWNIKVPKTVKKVASLILSETYFKSLSDRVVNFFGQFKKGTPVTAASQPVQRVAVSLQPDKAELELLRKNNYMQLLEVQNKCLHENIKAKASKLAIDLPEKKWIIDELNFIIDMRNAGGANYERIYDDASAAKFINQYEADPGTDKLYQYKFDENVPLESNIKNMEQSAYAQIADLRIGGVNSAATNGNLKGYNKLLSKVETSSGFLKLANISRFIGPCGSGAKLCIRCGLPCAFPVCLRRG